jgi:hypothetical protein
MSFDWNSPEMKRIIKGQIRRCFRRSPQFIECLKKARQEFAPLPKKDGSPGKKKIVKYKCAICENLFPQKWVQVDHIKPAIPLDKEEVNLSYDELVQGIVCGIENLQVICSVPTKENFNEVSCHRFKTNSENHVRRAIKELKEKGQFTELTDDLLLRLKLDYVADITLKYWDKAKKKNKK